MLLCIRRSVTLPSLTVLACILIGLIIMAKHIKELYEQNKKAQRFQLYNAFINEVAESITELESTSNRSHLALRRLNNVLEKYKKYKKRKIIGKALGF